MRSYLAHSAPVPFDGSSNHPISCLSMASKAILRMRSVRCSPATVNMRICRNMARPTTTPTPTKAKA